MNRRNIYNEISFFKNVRETAKTLTSNVKGQYQYTTANNLVKDALQKLEDYSKKTDLPYVDELYDNLKKSSDDIIESLQKKYVDERGFVASTAKENSSQEQAPEGGDSKEQPQQEQQAAPEQEIKVQPNFNISSELILPPGAKPVNHDFSKGPIPKILANPKTIEAIKEFRTDKNNNNPAQLKAWKDSKNPNQIYITLEKETSSRDNLWDAMTRNIKYFELEGTPTVTPSTKTQDTTQQNNTAPVENKESPPAQNTEQKTTDNKLANQKQQKVDSGEKAKLQKLFANANFKGLIKVVSSYLKIKDVSAIDVGKLKDGRVVISIKGTAGANTGEKAVQQTQQERKKTKERRFIKLGQKNKNISGSEQ